MDCRMIQHLHVQLRKNTTRGNLYTQTKKPILFRTGFKIYKPIFLENINSIALLT